MAFGGCGEDILETNMLCKNTDPTDKNLAVTDHSYSQNEQNLMNEKTLDDSLSSSASMSDSDLTSTDSEDSLALSESESITDVTPLNSPYCDSPLPQSRLLELKSEEKNVSNPVRNLDRTGVREGCCPPEVNVLMQAIEKLEVEAKKAEQPAVRASNLRRRTVSCGGEDGKRIEQENQRLFKRVISQQNRIRTMYPTTGQPCRRNMSNNRHQELVKSDGDISGLPKNMQSSRSLKDGAKYTQRQQKCLSHPSYMFPHAPLENKMVMKEDICSGGIDQNTHETSVDVPTSMLSSITDSGTLFNT